MKIYVQGKEIETKEIVQITEAGFRTHGFIIHLIGEREIPITQDELYDSYNHDKARINDKYRNLRERVESEWNKDKTDFIILNL